MSTPLLWSPASSRPARLAQRLPGPICILGGSLILAIAAHVAVPFWPVPITLQTLAVLGLGAVLGPGLAVAAVLATIAEALVGLPVFAGGPGPTALTGPTAGYIVGFLPAAALAGIAAQRGWLRRPLGALASFLAADTLIFLCGLAWLTSLFGWDRALAGGLVPFLLGEALKIGLATAGAHLWSARRA